MSHDDEEFESLAMKVASGVASPEEASRFDALLASEPNRRREFEEIRETLAAMREAGTLAGALQANSPELPAHRTGELRAAVRRNFAPSEPARKGFWSSPVWTWAGLSLVAACLVLALWPGPAVQIGLVETPAMRGGGEAAVPHSSTGVQVKTFDTADQLELWSASRWNRHLRARAWVDENAGKLHVVRRSREGVVSSQDLPLPRDPQARAREIERWASEPSK